MDKVLIRKIYDKFAEMDNAASKCLHCGMSIDNQVLTADIFVDYYNDLKPQLEKILAEDDL
jgi:hypothetical protein